MSKNFAEDYVDVATRLVEFREKHPEGSLQPADPAAPYKVERIGDATYIVVVAAAYRTPEDPRPGIGMAYEIYPGRTPYTRGSELQNAETSAWGRAIMAALAADSRKGIASAEEVRNRRAEREASTPAGRNTSEPSAGPLVFTAENLRNAIREFAVERSWDLKRVADGFAKDYGQSLKSCQDPEVLNTFFQQLEAEARAEQEGAA